MRVSVIVPSRLVKCPVSARDSLWLDRALMQVRRQQLPPGVEVEMIVGLDKGMADKVPGRFADETLMFVESQGNGQALAVNTAVKASTGDVLAFLEDDDYWEVDKLAVQLPFLEQYEFVSCVQREIDEMANFVGYNAFPTPSGWLMRRELWNRVGIMATPADGFWFHVDTEWLGRLNVILAGGAVGWNDREPGKRKRVHLAHQGFEHPWLDNVRRHSDVIYLPHSEPLVQRYRNPDGGMGTIAKNPQAKAQSDREHERMLATFGRVPW